MPLISVSNSTDRFWGGLGLPEIATRTILGEIERPSWLLIKLSAEHDILRGDTLLSIEVVWDGPPSVHRGKVAVVIHDVEGTEALLQSATEGLSEAFHSYHPLFERDPRIKWMCCSKPLPRSPLFDPRPGFPRTLDEIVEQARVCPLCAQPFLGSVAPIWGGGNLLWVHESCWSLT